MNKRSQENKIATSRDKPFQTKNNMSNWDIHKIGNQKNN